MAQALSLQYKAHRIMEEACPQIKCNLTAPHLLEHDVIIIQYALIVYCHKSLTFLYEKTCLLQFSYPDTKTLCLIDGNTVFLVQHIPEVNNIPNMMFSLV